MPSGVYKRPDVCKRGHSLENAYMWKGHRHCRQCGVIRQSALITKMRQTNPDRVKAKKHHEYVRNAAGYKARAKAHRHVRRARLAGCAQNDLTPGQWNLLKLVFNNRCAYCLAVCSNPHQDHIVPISRGGDNTLTNVVPSCGSCNDKKGTQLWKPLMKFGTYA